MVFVTAFAFLFFNLEEKSTFSFFYKSFRDYFRDYESTSEDGEMEVNEHHGNSSAKVLKMIGYKL